jgi:ribonuclease E
MASDQPTDTPTDSTTPPRRRRAASRPAGPPAEPTAEPPAKKTAATTARASDGATGADGDKPKRTRKKAAAAKPAASAAGSGEATETKPARKRTSKKTAASTAAAGAPSPIAVTFQPPEPVAAARPAKKAAATAAPAEAATTSTTAAKAPGDAGDGADPAEGAGEGGPRRRRRGRRGRGRSGQGDGAGTTDATTDEDAPDADTTGDADSTTTTGEGGPGSGSASSRRRRRRRRSDGSIIEETAAEDPPNTVVKVRQPRQRATTGGRDDEVRGVAGSTRLEARKQRRRDGREAGRRPTVLTESEFLARREAVERVMLVRQTKERTQIAVLEDGILVEHFVTRKEASSTVGNVYLGRVQNVLPSMEAAFVDIGKGRNAVLYAGEVNWDASGLEGQPRRIELALKSGQPVLVQVTKDPIGHKGARLTSQISLPGRYVAYVPEGRVAGISRKLPDTERTRLKNVLKQVTPEGAGVVVRTAAEGASEEDLGRDIRRLQAQWEVIDQKSRTSEAPAELYAEPDLVIRVIRDIFNEDFKELVVSGDDEWDTIEQYVAHLAPDLADRLRKWTDEKDIFSELRVDEQLVKALDRKVWLPSGGYLVIDRTEAMIVVDVNTGKFTGKGGNLEETVTKNNLEAAEELVRQMRLRDLGGIIVIDFVDMVLESNRDLVLRRLVECLGRDRTRHQVAEVTSLGLVQMTRKRVGTGLLEAFSETCPQCQGRGVLIHLDGAPHPRGDQPKGDRDRDRDRKSGSKRGGKSDGKSDGKRETKGESKAGDKHTELTDQPIEEVVATPA